MSWYQNSGYVVVKGIHPDAGIPYPRFHGDITPVPAAVVEALTRGGSRTVGDSESSVSMGTASAFLEPVRGRPNLRVLTRSLVHRVAIEGGRAAGVDYERGGGAGAARAAGRRRPIVRGR